MKNISTENSYLPRCFYPFLSCNVTSSLQDAMGNLDYLFLFHLKLNICHKVTHGTDLDGIIFLFAAVWLSDQFSPIISLLNRLRGIYRPFSSPVISWKEEITNLYCVPRGEPINKVNTQAAIDFLCANRIYISLVLKLLILSINH